MPYYKKDLYVEEAINSIINQTHQEFEIILIDDEISKKSNEVLEKIKKKDKRIKIIYNIKNLGAGESRNMGIRFAKGEYIAFCDSDDLWRKNKLEEQLKFMRNLNVNFSYTSYEIIDEKGEIAGHRDAVFDTNFKKLLLSCDIGLSTVILKKVCLQIKIISFRKLKQKRTLWFG